MRFPLSSRLRGRWFGVSSQCGTGQWGLTTATAALECENDVGGRFTLWPSGNAHLPSCLSYCTATSCGPAARLAVAHEPLGPWREGPSSAASRRWTTRSPSPPLAARRAASSRLDSPDNPSGPTRSGGPFAPALRWPRRFGFAPEPLSVLVGPVHPQPGDSSTRRGSGCCWVRRSCPRRSKRGRRVRRRRGFPDRRGEPDVRTTLRRALHPPPREGLRRDSDALPDELRPVPSARPCGRWRPRCSAGTYRRSDGPLVFPHGIDGPGSDPPWRAAWACPMPVLPDADAGIPKRWVAPGNGRKRPRGIAAPATVAQGQERQRPARPGPCPAGRRLSVRPPPMSRGHLRIGNGWADDCLHITASRSKIAKLRHDR